MNIHDIDIDFKPFENGVMALLPGNWVSCFRLALPKLPERKLSRILPNIMADHIADKETDVHFAMLDSFDNGEYLVAVCRKDVIGKAQEMAREQGHTLRAIWPDYATLETPDKGFVSLEKDGSIHCRKDDGTGFTCQADLFPAYALGQNSASPIAEIKYPDGPGLAVAEFGPQAPIMESLAHIKRAAILIVLLFAVWAGEISYQIFENKQIRREYQDAQINLFKEAFPEVRRIVDVEAQLKSASLARNGGHANSPLPMINSVFSIIKEFPGIGLEAVLYGQQQQQNSLSITVVSSDFADADRIKARFQKSGILVSDQGGRQEGDRVYNDFDLSEVK